MQAMLASIAVATHVQTANFGLYILSILTSDTHIRILHIIIIYLHVCTNT